MNSGTEFGTSVEALADLTYFKIQASFLLATISKHNTRSIRGAKSISSTKIKGEEFRTAYLLLNTNYFQRERRQLPKERKRETLN